MSEYFNIQKRAFKDSFAMVRPLKSYLLELTKSVLVVSLALVFGVVFFRLFRRMQPLLDIIDQINYNSNNIPVEMTTQFVQNQHLFGQFLTGAIILLILTIILFTFITTYFDVVLINLWKKQNWTKGTYFTYLKIYSIIICIFMILGTVSVLFINNLLILFIMLSIQFLFYNYILDMYQISIKDKEHMLKNSLYGIKSIIKLRYNMVPAVVVLFGAIIVLLLGLLLMVAIKMYAILLLAVAGVLISLWAKNYFFRLHSLI